MDIRVGMGYDIHRLVEGRKFILGGVDIPYHMGLLGHSDADVLLHAVIDAILGAMGEPDIGTNFPDKDPAYKGISSKVLLDEVKKIMHAKGFKVNNLDCIIVTEEPKIGPYRGEIIGTISSILEIPSSSVNVKSKTNEELGPVGQKEAVVSYAVVTIVKNTMTRPRSGGKK
ncbi:MAG: 2-C-methyl-D-erythritol 2,4-cyclodiphosphate synthase [Candidatus Omnitrophica bacterium]|nr:2-C-methyl-D-erythritol 2,4-cyclodiphosphate synthase [Candidatus Omnitrophota bacterium]